MFTIRIKGKYIILAAALVLFLSGMLYTAAARAVSLRELQQAQQSENPEEYVRLLRELYPNPSDAARELYDSAMRDAGVGGGEQRNTVYIFPDMNWKSTLVGEQENQLERGVAKYELLLEHFPETSRATHALRQLGHAYFDLGDYEQAEHYFLVSIENSGDAESAHALARLYLDRGDYRAALDVAEDSLTRQPQHLAMDMLFVKGQALLALGEWDEAEATFRAILQKDQDDIVRFPDDEDEGLMPRSNNHWADTATLSLERLAQLRSGKETGVVTGRVTLGGANFSGVRVYLMDRTVERPSFGTAEIINMRQVVADAEGRFVFEDVLPGIYNFGVAVRIPDVEGYTLQQQDDFEVISGQNTDQALKFLANAIVRHPLGGDVFAGDVEFRWDEVDGAHSYSIQVNTMWPGENRIGPYGTVLRSGVTENRVVINLEEELQVARFFPSFGYSNGYLQPLSVFGQIFRGGEFAWSVSALDSNGKKISDSTGYGRFVGEEELPVFRIQGELSAADKLLLAEDYAGAIAAYEDSAAANPGDTHSLLMLARIHHFGVRYDERDLPQAAHYYERLIKVEDTPEARNALATVRFKLGHYEEAYGLYRTLIDTRAESWDTHFSLAKAAFRLGRPIDALQSMKQAVEMEHGRYAREWPVALALVMGEEEQALLFARRVDGGERYADLLAACINEGYSVPDAFHGALLSGEYDTARQLLGEKTYDQFMAILLDYLEHQKRPQDVGTLTPGNCKSLLQNMLPG